MSSPNCSTIGVTPGTTIEFVIDAPSNGPHNIFLQHEYDNRTLISGKELVKPNSGEHLLKNEFKKIGEHEIRMVAVEKGSNPRKLVEIPEKEIINAETWSVFCVDRTQTGARTIGRTAWEAIQVGTTIYTLGSAGKHLSDRIQDHIQSQDGNEEVEEVDIDKNIKPLDEFD